MNSKNIDWRTVQVLLLLSVPAIGALGLIGWILSAIPAEFLIGDKTVGFHLDQIHTKIDVRTRLMAGVWALQQGIGQKLGKSLARM